MSTDPAKNAEFREMVRLAYNEPFAEQSLPELLKYISHLRYKLMSGEEIDREQAKKEIKSIKFCGTRKK